MTQLACPFTNRLSAARSEALSPDEHVRLRDHLRRGCSLCEAEQRYLDWLGHELRARAPSLDEVALQRNKHVLLADAAQQRRHPSTQRARHAGVLQGAIAAAAVGGFGLWSIDRSPDISVTCEAGTPQVRRYTEGEHAIVQLGDGRYKLQVSRGALDRSVLVRLPDGEIEDIGTVFDVTIEQGRTLRVSVSEGAVKLRVQAAPQQTLAAGSVWQAAAGWAAAQPEEPTSVEPAQTAREHEPSVQGGSPVPLDRVVVVPEATKAPSPQRQHVVAARSAAKPRSPSPTPTVMTEDAMYLRVLDLLREHRVGDARALAARYLTEFPQGFRRREVSAVAGLAACSDTPEACASPR